jgi:hypothetical protein
MWNSTKILGRNPNAFILWNSKLHATRLNLEACNIHLNYYVAHNCGIGIDFDTEKYFFLLRTWYETNNM